MKQQLIACLDEFASGWRDECDLPPDPMVRTARIQRWMASRLAPLSGHLPSDGGMLNSVMAALRTGASVRDWEDLWFDVRYPHQEPGDPTLHSGQSTLVERMLESAIAYGWSASRSPSLAEEQHDALHFVHTLVAFLAFQDNAELEWCGSSDAHTRPFWHAQAAILRSFLCIEE